MSISNNKNDHSEAENGNLSVDDERNEATLELFLTYNPRISRKALEDFGVETGTRAIRRKSDDNIVDVPCLYFPLCDQQAKEVNALVVLADRPLTYRKQQYLENDRHYGILCSQALYTYINNGSPKLENAVFCDQLLDVLLLASTTNEERRKHDVVFSVFGPGDRICCDEDLPGHDDEGRIGYASPNVTVVALLNKFREEEIAFYKWDVTYEVTRTKGQDQMDCFITSIYNRNKSITPPSLTGKSIPEYIQSGGTLHGLLGWQKLNNHIAPQEVIQREEEWGESLQQQSAIPPQRGLAWSQDGWEVCTEWLDGITHKERIKRYSCADEGSPLNQFGPEEGTLTLLGGVPGHGKTAFAMANIIEAAYRNDDLETILIVNTDQRAMDLWRREISRITRIPLEDIRNNRIFHDVEYKHHLQLAIPKIKLITDKFHFYARPPITLERIESEVERLKPQILVLDHLNEIQVERNPKLKTQDRIGHLMPVIRGFVSRGIAVLGVCAFNRTGAARAKYTSPDFSAIRDSSSLEYCASKVWFLRTVNQKKFGHTHILEGKKDKESLQTDIPLNFDGAKMRFTVAESLPEPGMIAPAFVMEGTVIQVPRSLHATCKLTGHNMTSR